MSVFTCTVAGYPLLQYFLANLKKHLILHGNIYTIHLYIVLGEPYLCPSPESKGNIYFIKNFMKFLLDRYTCSLDFLRTL